MTNYTLYHYVHCPFCIRVRMALGYLKLDYKSVVLPYDDEKTPIALTGKKMLPALNDGNQTINESLDIIQLIDKKNSLHVKEIIEAADFKELETFLDQLGKPIHSLAMPYWIYTAEFDQSSREYFQNKKEEKRGPFKDLLANQDIFFQQLTPLLEKLENDLNPYYNSGHFTLKDILIASHLWGLYLVPEFQFSEKIHSYLQKVKSECHFNYHQDFLGMI